MNPSNLLKKYGISGLTPEEDAEQSLPRHMVISMEHTRTHQHPQTSQTMKTRRNPFLVAATVLLAGQQAAFAIDYNLYVLTGQTFTWNNDVSWNPDATGGTGPLASDSVVISGDLTVITTINYATGTTAIRGITNITVTDSNNVNNSGAMFTFGAGVTGSALQSPQLE